MLLAIPDVWSRLTTGDHSSVFLISFFIIIPVGLASGALAVVLIFKRLSNGIGDNGMGEMVKMHLYIRDGAKTYLLRQAKTLLAIVAVLFIPVGLTGTNFLETPLLGVLVTGAVFSLGSLSSLFAGYISMDAATRANILVVRAAMENPLLGFKRGFYAGMISGILNISTFVFGIWVLFIVSLGNVNVLVGYSFGASVASLLAQVGGGIYTKAADMGADLVGKFEIGIEEDDPRNPAIIADAVGDNVGDCAGRGADLFESASSDAIGGMLLGLTIFLLTGNPIFIIANITLLSTGIFATFIASRFLKSDIEKNPTRVVWVVFTAATVFNFALLFGINVFLFGEHGYLLFLASTGGLVASLLSIMITLYYTDIKHRPTSKIASASQEGPAINAVTGLAMGFESTLFPIIVFGGAIIVAYMCGHQYGALYFQELSVQGLSSTFLGETPTVATFSFIFAIWGINMASVTSDMLISTILSFDTFGPIMDNAAGITQMCQDEGDTESLRCVLDKLDATGNTTKAIAKGFALVCGGFSSIVLFQTFILDTGTLSISMDSLFSGINPVDMILVPVITHPLVILGLMVGVTLPFVFSSLVIQAVGIGAGAMVREVRNQFNTIPGLKEGKATPDYNRCIDISAKTALKKMIAPVVLIITVPVGFGIVFGPFATGGLLVGNLIGCLIVGLFMTMSGGAFDNAKKAIESGLLGGKGTPAHKASIIGDTIGDPLKDSAGPSMNIEITTVNTLALTFLPLIMSAGWLWVLFPFF